MENRLIQKLNDLSGGKYDFLKLSYVNVSKQACAAEFALIYPEEYERQLGEERDVIEAFIAKITGGALKAKVRLIKSCFFEDTLTDELITYLGGYPSVSTSIDKENIIIEDRNGKKNISIGLPASIHGYAVTAGILQSAKEFFSYKYCQTLNFEFSVSDEDKPTAENIEKFIRKNSGGGSCFEKEGGRLISVDNREDFIGDIIYEDAAYISDAKVSDKIILCGKIENFTILSRKPKPGEEATDKKFYKFKLRDFTGVINCLYFPTQKTENLILSLCDGKSIIAFGKTAEDNYNNDGKLVFTVRNITLCTLPAGFKENRIMIKVNDEYLAVKPEPYIKPVQSSLFEVKEIIPASLAGKKFCVFDLETTGLDPENNEIMEVGAVIIDNGVIEETFSTFVSINNTVPEKIIQLTGITDSDLIGKPCVKDVLTDFFKFSYGLPLVGQNVAFDYGFISVHGAKHHIHFDNERIDTITLSRKYLRNMKNFTLKSIAEKLEVKNEDAHRALSDAVATAEIFIKLSKMSE